MLLVFLIFWFTPAE